MFVMWELCHQRGLEEFGLAAAGLAAEDGVLGVGGLEAAGELLVALARGCRVTPVAGRDEAGVLVVGLK